jgi:hypothetical protein
VAISVFTDDDLGQLEERGILMKEVRRQLDQYEDPPGYSNLVRPCTVGDGIVRLSEADLPRLAAFHDAAAEAGRITKFVPASGAATRMFKDLIPCLQGEGNNGEELQKFVRGLPRFAFHHDLRDELAHAGADLDCLVAAEEYRPIVKALLSEDGLDYAALPKGLLPFHGYGDSSRTAFEEHVVEAASYARDRHGVCRMHFTVSPEHLTGFTSHFRDVGLRYMDRFSAQFDMGCSNQKPSTDTLAVGPDNLPFRTGGGRLLFRPGGHGALIENLADLEGDIVFIKNIDNVQPERLLPTVSLWKKGLGGCLLELQQELFNLEERLEREDTGAVWTVCADRCGYAAWFRIPGNRVAGRSGWTGRTAWRPPRSSRRPRSIRTRRNSRPAWRRRPTSTRWTWSAVFGTEMENRMISIGM